MRLSAYPEACEGSCKKPHHCVHAGYGFYIRGAARRAAQIPAFVRGGGSKKEKGVCLQDAYY